MSDSERRRACLDAGGNGAVSGGGWLGAEVAASASQRGLGVTLIVVVSVPLVRILGTEVGGIYRDIHADHGVHLHLGAGVQAFEGASAVERVRTTGDETVDCDFVVVGVGVAPRTDLAEAAGLSVDDGVLTDAPADHPYGERQYSAEDPAGHRWTFSQTIADVDPTDWGGEVGEG